MHTRIRLRDIQPEDEPILVAQQLDVEAARRAGFPARDQALFDTQWGNTRGNPATVAMTILLGDNVAGKIGSWQQDGVRLVGYWIGRKYWGSGVAPEALARFLCIVTARPLYAHVVNHNHPSIRVLEKCGFRLASEKAIEAGDGESAEVLLVLS